MFIRFWHVITDFWDPPDPLVKLVSASRGTTLFKGLRISLREEHNSLYLEKLIEICPVKFSSAICKHSDCCNSQFRYRVVVDRNVVEKSFPARKSKYDLAPLINLAIISGLVVIVLPG